MGYFKTSRKQIHKQRQEMTINPNKSGMCKSVTQSFSKSKEKCRQVYTVEENVIIIKMTNLTLHYFKEMLSIKLYVVFS